MAALAYVLLPVTGLIAYFVGSDPRTRFHGLQAIVLGLIWPAALYLGSTISPETTQAVGGIGALVWVGFIVTALLGRDLRLPVVGRVLERAAKVSPRAWLRSTSGK